MSAAVLSAADALREQIFAGEQYARERLQQTIESQYTESWSATGSVFPFETGTIGSDDFGLWRNRDWRNWGAGFVPGQLWHFAGQTEEATWLEWAHAYTDAVAGWQNRRGNHDIGFNLLASFGDAYHLFGEPGDAQVLVNGAATFSNEHWLPVVGSLWSFDFNNNQRIDPAGSERVRGPIRAKQNVIIDTTMNIELLFAGARLAEMTQWQDKIDWYERGLSHLRNVVRDMVREDGGTIQVVDYWLTDQLDPLTGEVLHPAGSLRGARAWQGYSSESTWSRGQGWAIHGLASGYRETGDPLVLQGLLQTAEYWIAHVPADGIPYWDFDAPFIEDPGYLDAYAEHDMLGRDTSAAAIAAAGFLELYRLLDDSELRERYFAVAQQILYALSKPLAEGGGIPVLVPGLKVF